MSDKDEEEEEEEGIVVEDLSVGVVSVGDVLLNNLKQLIEAAGVTVEFRLTASGGVLVCGSQVRYSLSSSIYLSFLLLFYVTRIDETRYKIFFLFSLQISAVRLLLLGLELCSLNSL